MAPASGFLSFFGWSFIPDFATRYLLSFIHRSLASKAGFVPPIPGTPTYRKHYAYTFSFVVLGYLLYTMVGSARSLPPNFYEILGVSPDVDENGLKAAFRLFAKKNHPDRLVGASAQEMEEGMKLFMTVREVFESLKDPIVRFAYDRFGQDVLLWKTCSTRREFLHQGLLQASGYHIVTLAILLFWSAIGNPSPVSFWRYLLFSTLLVSELALILAPSTPKPGHILAYLFPNRTTHQHILFLHQLFIFFSFALSRVAPQLFPSADDPRFEKVVLERAQALASAADREASIILHADLHSIAEPASHNTKHATLPLLTPLPQPQIVSLMLSLRTKMASLIVEHNLKKDAGPLNSVWENAVRRGRAAVVGSSTTNGTQNQVKNFWEAAGDADVTITASDSGSSIIDGSAYLVVDEQMPTAPELDEKDSEEIDGPGESSPSPRPSPHLTTSPSEQTLTTGITSRKASSELLVD